MAPLPFSRITFFYLMVSLIGTAGAMSPSFFGQKNSKPDFNGKKNSKPAKKNPLLDKEKPEILQIKAKATTAKDFSLVIKCLDALLSKTDDHEQKQGILLEIADTYFQQQDWAKAERYYEEFLLLYPGAQQGDYAHYKGVLSGWNQTLDPERDQTKTQDTLKQAQKFASTFTQSSYYDKIETIMHDCHQKLLESDRSIFNFYCHNKNYKAAAKRLEYIDKEYMPHAPHLKPEYLELTIQLAQAKNDTPAALKAQWELATQFTDHQITKRLALDAPALTLQLAALEPAKSSDSTASPAIIAQAPLKNGNKTAS